MFLSDFDKFLICCALDQYKGHVFFLYEPIRTFKEWHSPFEKISIFLSKWISKIIKDRKNLLNKS